MRGLHRRRLSPQGDRAFLRTGLLSGLRRVGAAAGILAVLVVSVVQEPADTGARATGEPAQRHTAAPSATPSETEGSHERDGAIRFTAPTEANPPALARFYSQRVRWRSCPDDAALDCAEVKVPIDHAKPRGSTVALALRRLPSTSREPRGTLFVNPGGPGGSGVAFVQEPGQFGSELRKAWDIVGFDPRGIGESGGFDCLTDDDLDDVYGSDPTPPSDAGVLALQAAAEERVAGCLGRGGPLARHMGSEAVAADLDILREVVGDERLNYYGVSYGTLIGAIYADRFTSRVGLMVLDSAVSPNGLDSANLTQRDVDTNLRFWAAQFDSLFADFVKACGGSTASGACPLGADARTAGERVLHLLDSLESVPMTTDFASLPQLTEGWAVTAIGEGLLDVASWPYLVDALDQAINDEDATELAWFAMVSVGRDVDGTYPGASYGKNHLPVICSDWPQSGWERITASPAVVEEHPLFGRIQPMLPPECTGWEGQPRSELLVAAEPATPVLVIGNEHDPVTTIRDTEHLSDRLAGSRLVTVDSATHGAFGTGNQCADQVVEHYLVQGIAPPDRTRCPSPGSR